MPLQEKAFLTWLGLAVFIAAVFAFVALRSRKAIPVDYRRANRLRLFFFLGLVSALLVFLGVTLPRVPYPTEAQRPDRVVFVVGKQFNFAISERPVTTDQEWEEAVTYGEEVVLRRGELVEFRVTSLDVNHGFSLYDPDHVLIGQVQAMPGYMNRLRFRFEKPGRYDVLCLEYCGHGHPRMRGYFRVE